MVNLFSNIEPFVHVFNVGKSKLLSINKVNLELFYIMFNKINMVEDKHENEEYSFIKSIRKIHLF